MFNEPIFSLRCPPIPTRLAQYYEGPNKTKIRDKIKIKKIFFSIKIPYLCYLFVAEKIVSNRLLSAELPRRVFTKTRKKRSSYKNCGKMFGKVLLLRLGLKGFYEEENGKILL